MSSSPRTIEATRPTENTILNLVNNVSGGAMFVVNGHASPVDYEHIAMLLKVLSDLNGYSSTPYQTPICTALKSLSHHRIQTMLLVHHCPTLGNVHPVLWIC
jgi:hypothetical protein